MYHQEWSYVRQMWTTQHLNDAWDAANWDGLCGTTLWQMVAPELKLAKLHLTRKLSEAHGHTGGCPGCAALASHGRATNPHNNECRERIRTIIERTLTGKARMNAYKDGVAETERVKERIRTQVERGAGDVLMEREK